MTEDLRPQTSTDGGGLKELIQTQPRLANALGAGIIVVLTFLAYIPAINGLFIWDDNHHVVDNTLLRDWEGLGRIWTDVFPHPSEYPLPQYYPLTHTSFWIEYHLGGHNENGIPTPTLYHITNVVLHICNALLIWWLLLRLQVPGAWLAAALFALHPINAETVSWISERKNVLSMFFFLTSLYVYLRYAGIIQSTPMKSDEEPTWRLPDDPGRLYSLAVVLFLCALFSKTITSSMPAVALVVIWWKRGRLSWDDFRSALPLLAMGAGMGALTGYMEYWRVGVVTRPKYWHFAATPAGEFAARTIIAGRVVWFYVLKLLFPFPLIFNYSRWTIDPSDLVMYLFPLSVLAILASLVLLSRRIGRGPAAAALIFVGTLFPAMGFVDVWPMQYSFVADHYVYLSSVGIFALASALLWKHLTLEGFAGVAVCVLLVFTGMSWGHSRDMSELNLLWRDTLEKTSYRSWFAMNNYAVLIRDSNILSDPYQRLDEAELRFKRVIELKPDHPEARFNLAIIAERRGLMAQMAQSATQPSTQMATSRPTSQPNDYFEQALAYYREAIAVEPNFVPAHYGMANLLRALERNDEAIAEYRKTLEYSPRHDGARAVLADYEMAAGNPAEAAKHLAILVDLFPRDPRAHADLGWALIQAGNLVGGFAEWEVTLGMVPTDPSYANEFGARLASTDNPRALGKAFDYFRIAYQIQPRSPEVLTNLGVTAARLGHPDQARTFLNEALTVKPDFALARQKLDDLNAGRLRPATTQSSTQPTTQASVIQKAITEYMNKLLRDPGAGKREAERPAGDCR